MPTRTRPAIVQQARKPFDQYVNEALHAREGKDNFQWVLGDIANEVRVFYGEDSIGKLATEIGMKKSTLLTYRTVSKVFPPAKRLNGLSFTHHQLCCPRPNSEEWLHKCADGMWSCEKLSYEIDQTKDDNPELNAKRDAKIKMAAQYLKTQFDSFARLDIEHETGIITHSPNETQCKNIVLRVMDIIRRGE